MNAKPSKEKVFQSAGFLSIVVALALVTVFSPLTELASISGGLMVLLLLAVCISIVFVKLNRLIQSVD
jgi:hypothetical protein